MRALCNGLLLPMLLAAGTAAETPVERLIDDARAECAAFEGGSFDPGNAVSRIDLTGDGAPDTIVDEGAFACTSAASLYCGTGGCRVHGIVGDTVTSWQATGWRVIDWGADRVLLIARDGGWCGGIGAETCYEALNWRDGRFLTVMAPPEPAAVPGQGPEAPYSAGDYDATTTLRCSLGEPTQDQFCPAGVLRGEPGAATIRVLTPDGAERVLVFSGGTISSPGTDDLTWARDGDDWYIGIGGREYYIVPDAAVSGG